MALFIPCLPAVKTKITVTVTMINAAMIPTFSNRSLAGSTLISRCGSPLARSGSQFVHDVENMSFEEREAAILEECISGNIPYFLRDLKTLKARFFDADSQAHAIEYRVFPDYLAIGSDSNYCRVPMGPVTAQKIADFL